MIHHLRLRFTWLFLFLILLVGCVSAARRFDGDQLDQDQQEWVNWMNELLQNQDHKDWPSKANGWCASATYHVLYINDRGVLQAGLDGRSFVTVKHNVDALNGDALGTYDEDKELLMLNIFQSLLISGEPDSFTYEQGYGGAPAPGFRFRIKGEKLPGKVWSIYSCNNQEITRNGDILVKVVIGYWRRYFIKSMQFEAA